VADEGMHRFAAEYQSVDIRSIASLVDSIVLGIVIGPLASPPG